MRYSGTFADMDDYAPISRACEDGLCDECEMDDCTHICHDPIPDQPVGTDTGVPVRAARMAMAVPRVAARRFPAETDSICPACEQPLTEGAPASWLRRGVAGHDTCAQAAGIHVYDPR